MGKGEEGAVASHDDEGGAGGAKREGTLLGIKLRRGVTIAKRGGLCTPAPAWKLEEVVEEEEEEEEEDAWPSQPRDSVDAAADSNQYRARLRQHRRRRGLLAFPVSATAGAGAAVSARKLCANLWKIQESLQPSRMSKRGARSRHCRGEKLADLGDLSPFGPYEQPQSAGSLRRHVAESLIHHHKSSNRNDHALQPVSPACYSSSMEVAAYNLVVTPTNSLDLKGRLGYSFKTSTELLKVLNRIWSLEEQHASNISLVKTLKFELEHAEAQIQKLLMDKESVHHEMDGLVKQITKDKLVRRSKEQERINTAVQSMRDELDEERRLRTYSESLHQKLAKEFSEVKSAFSKTLKDLEREKMAHKSLQYLCDEFARGIREYEEEVRELKQRPEKGCDLRNDQPVLHISEAWLDERLQMKLAETRGDHSEKNMIMNRLMCEIESFLNARQRHSVINDVSIHNDAPKDRYSRRHSIESVHLNGPITAPLDVEDEGSLASNFHCFKPTMDTSATESHGSFKLNGIQSVETLEEARKSSVAWKMMKSSERLRCQNSSSSQVKFKAHAQSCDKGKMQFIKRVQGIHTRNMSEGSKDANQIDVVLSQISENGDTQEVGQVTNVKQECLHGLNHIINDTFSGSELGQISRAQPEDEHMEDSCNAFSWRRQFLMVGRDNASSDYCALSSPVQQWSYHSTATNLGVTECPSKVPQDIKENTLKAKLLEARLEVQHARLKAGRGSSAQHARLKAGRGPSAGA